VATVDIAWASNSVEDQLTFGAAMYEVTAGSAAEDGQLVAAAEMYEMDSATVFVKVTYVALPPALA